MNAKLLSFDISKNESGTLSQHVETEIVNEIENQTEEILGEFFNEMELFTRLTMEQSSAKQKCFLNQWNEQSGNTDIKKQPPDQPVALIEKLEVENEIAYAENSLAQFQKNLDIERLSNETVINEFKSRLDESIKTAELQKNDNTLLNSENALLKEKLETAKKITADLEGQNRIFSAEIKIEKRELEFIEKKFLSERTELHEKINALQQKLDSVLIEAEILKKDKMKVEFESIQSQKAFEHLNDLNGFLKLELASREESIKSKEFEINNKEEEIRSKDTEIRNKEAEIRKIQEKSYQNDAIQVGKIHMLEGKLKQNYADYSKKIQELEDKLSDSLNFFHVMEGEKHEALEAVNRIEKEMIHLESELTRAKTEAEVNIKAANSATDEKHKLTEQVQKLQALNNETEHRNRILSQEVKNLSERISSLSEQLRSSSEHISSLSEQLRSSSEHISSLSEQVKTEKRALESFKKKAEMESVALNTQIDELASKLNEARKQKELLIANKLNSTLQIKKDSYTENSPGGLRLLKYASITFSVIIILILGYLLFSHYYSPEIQKELKKEVTALSSELESKSEYINAMTIEQRQLTAKLEDLSLQVKVLNTPTASISTPAPTASAPAVVPPLTNHLIESIYFDSGISSLNETEINKIKSVADNYNGNPYIFIRLEGHTDDKMFRFPMFNQYSNNLGLSIARAAEVSRLLVQYGMDTRQISIVGLGDMYPLVPNDNSENREKNRRVEIKLTANSKGIENSKP